MKGETGTRLRYLVGSNFARLQHACLSARWFPLTRYIPYGRFCWYDIQRFAGRKQFRAIFDVGANVGQTAHGLVRYFPTADIYCFEPAAASFAQLVADYGTRPNVHCEQLALGGAPEARLLAIHASSEYNTFAASDASPLTHESVAVDTIDRFASERGIRSIDILKMDVQGWEREVIKGAATLLASNGIHFVVSEVGFSRLDRDMSQFAEIHPLLESAGLRFCGLYDNFRWGNPKRFVYFANAVYMNPAFKS